MEDDATRTVQQCARSGRIRFTHHALVRSRERGINRADVIQILATQYSKPDDRDRSQFITWGDAQGRRVRIISRLVEPFLLIITVIHD